MPYHLGVDLGTTYTAAAVWRDGQVEIASLGTRGPVVPSVVLRRDDGTLLTGEAAERRAVIQPMRVAREFKRRLGDPTPIILGDTPYPADALMARLLRSVVDAVAQQEGESPASITVSHPANWGPFKLDLLQHAIGLAGLGDADVGTVPEPEAAAIHYASQQRVAPGDVVAVYDLGGGTFDAGVLRRTPGGWEVLGTPEGIEHLGGIDFDEAVFHHVRTTIGEPFDRLHPDDPAAMTAVARLRRECVAAKEALSSDVDVSIPVLLPNLQTDVRLVRAELEAMIRPTLVDTVNALRRALRSAEVELDDVSAVLLVGGSSRAPLVAQLVGSELRRPVAVDTHPKHAVALGAAIVAAERAAGSVLDTRVVPTIEVFEPAPVGAPVGSRTWARPGALVPAASAPAAAALAGSTSPVAPVVPNGIGAPRPPGPGVPSPGAPAGERVAVGRPVAVASASGPPGPGVPAPRPPAGERVAAGRPVAVAPAPGPPAPPPPVGGGPAASRPAAGFRAPTAWSDRGAGAVARDEPTVIRPRVTVPPQEAVPAPSSAPWDPTNRGPERAGEDRSRQRSPGSRRWVPWSAAVALALVAAVIGALTVIPLGAGEETRESSAGSSSIPSSVPSSVPVAVSEEPAVSSVSVDALEPGWTDTELDVAAGDEVRITATGEIVDDVNGHPDRTFPPDGVPDLRGEHTGDRFRDINHAALIGRIGDDGEVFAVGADHQATVTTPGRLQLAINDSRFDDNQGSFEVQITVTPPTPPT